MVQFSQKTTKKMYLEDSSQKLERSKKKSFFDIPVSKFQNELMKLSFLPKYEPKIVRISAWAQYRAEIFTMFGSYFGRNDNFINSF